MKNGKEGEKKMKVAINGFQSIGKLVLRAFFETAIKKKYGFEIVAINDFVNIDAAILF